MHLDPVPLLLDGVEVPGPEDRRSSRSRTGRPRP